MTAGRAPEAGALASALHAAAAAPGRAGTLHLFGQFVGSWALAWSGRDTRGRPARMTGELHVGWVLAGRAIQDVWIVPCHDDPAEGRAPGFHGTTVRFPDPGTGIWQSIWIDPPNGRVRRFRAYPAGHNIELISDDERPRLRWRFTGITPASFRWTGEISAGDDAEWVSQQQMLATRTSPATPPPADSLLKPDLFSCFSPQARNCWPQRPPGWGRSP